MTPITFYDHAHLINAILENAYIEVMQKTGEAPTLVSIPAWCVDCMIKEKFMVREVSTQGINGQKTHVITQPMWRHVEVKRSEQNKLAIVCNKQCTVTRNLADYLI